MFQAYAASLSQHVSCPTYYEIIYTSYRRICSPLKQSYLSQYISQHTQVQRPSKTMAMKPQIQLQKPPTNPKSPRTKIHTTSKTPLQTANIQPKLLNTFQIKPQKLPPATTTHSTAKKLTPSSNTTKSHQCRCEARLRDSIGIALPTPIKR